MKALACVILANCVAYSLAQDVLTVLKQQTGISQFTRLLSQYSDLIDSLDAGVHTLVVPTDAAVSQANASIPSFFADPAGTRALVEYHILNGTHPSATFPNTSQLVATFLTNAAYTNVTGGQRVVLTSKDGDAAFLSAAQAESKITHADIFYVGGLIHIVDSMLQIPLDLPTTLNRANLTYLVALLDKGNWLTPNSLAYNISLSTPGLTIMGPNDPAYGSDYTGWDGLTQTQLDQIFLYHCLPGAIYTPDMKNNSHLETMANLTITSRTYSAPAQNPAIFIDQSLITTSNFLTANGVFHVINKPLNPLTPDASPAPSEISAALDIPSATNQTGLSSALIAGVTIGAVAIIVAVGLTVGLKVRILRKRQREWNAAFPCPMPRQAPPDYQTATRRYSLSTSAKRNSSKNITQNFSMPRTWMNVPLPAPPKSAARSIAPIGGLLGSSRPPPQDVVHLDAEDHDVHVGEVRAGENNPGSRARGLPNTVSNSACGSVMAIDTRFAAPRTPPEPDGWGRRRDRSLDRPNTLLITFHGERPRHIGFQTEY